MKTTDCCLATMRRIIDRMQAGRCCPSTSLVGRSKLWAWAVSVALTVAFFAYMGNVPGEPPAEPEATLAEPAKPFGRTAVVRAASPMVATAIKLIEPLRAAKL